MEDQVLQLLQATTTPDTNVIRNAEQGLLSLYSNPEFPFALLNIASHGNVDPGSRKASLTALKNYVSATWSPQLDETFKGAVYLEENAKSRVRDQIFALCTTEGNDRVKKDGNVQSLAAGVASRIASVDFPDQWPSLFPSLLSMLNHATSDAPLLGAMRVLLELIDSGFTEEQFFTIAQDLVNGLQHVVTSQKHGLVLRAMTLKVFRACFEMLEMVMAQHSQAVKAFLDDSLKMWLPFFLETIQEPLPTGSDQTVANEQWRGLVVLKVQVVKTIDKVRRVYVQVLSPHVLTLFQAMWEELSRVAPVYSDLFLNGHDEGKLVDGDGLPYTLDALILEEIDFLAAALKAPPVRSELSKQMKAIPDAPHSVVWLQELLRVLVLYSRIPKEEEALWEYDTNLYLCEQSALTANYSPRAACAELCVRSLCEWLKQVPLQALLYLSENTLTASNTGWKEKEALRYLLTQMLKDLDEMQGTLQPQTATAAMQQVSSSLHDSNLFLRAASQLALGTLFRVAGKDFFDAGAAALTSAIQAANSDESHLVQISCISIMHDYLEALPESVTVPLQEAVIDTISEFISAHDLRDELEDADDIKAALIQTLRDAIMLNTAAIVDSKGIDMFFTLASDGAGVFILSSQLTEAFASIVESVVGQSHDLYVQLCAKTIPSLTGAFDVANMTHESALTNLAAELVSALVEFGSEPLPDGFVPAVMPKLQRVLMEGTEAELVRPATVAVSFMLNKGSAQFLQWNDAQGKSSVEVTLTIVNRLLNSPDVEEAAATEVGGLASALVNKAGAERLGPYLMDLLRAVAIRLATAESIAFIQSLLMVFANLTTAAATEVVDFLSQVNINGANGLTVVLTKWLENSIHFAGFDEVRTNAIALSKLYSLHDPRISSIVVQGDLLLDTNTSGRIKTRSQARMNPDRYETIPAELKILKLLVEELSFAAATTNQYLHVGASSAAHNALNDGGDDNSLNADDEEDDGDWEDMAHEGALDLNSDFVRNDLMRLAGEEGRLSPSGSRMRDDESAEYLLSWFRTEAQAPGFEEMFGRLRDGEKEKLRILLS